MSKPILLTYPDKSRTHISCESRDLLLAASPAPLIRKTGYNRFLYVGEVHTYHSLSALIKFAVAHPPALRKYLAGLFIFEIGRVRLRERMETPEGMAIRLEKQRAASGV